jgi:hypothetical protein
MAFSSLDQSPSALPNSNVLMALRVPSKDIVALPSLRRPEKWKIKTCYDGINNTVCGNAVYAVYAVYARAGLFS